MKLPYIQFYIGDWQKDPELSMCSPATRGVWIDLICAMHELDRRGELRGTPEQLSRLARCSSVELTHALTDLQTNLAADVTERNGVVTVVNRRMKKANDARENNLRRQQRYRNVTHKKREHSPIYENEDEGLLKVGEFARGEGISLRDAEWFFWKCHANDWTNAGRPIRDWKATLRSWDKAGYLPSQKQKRPPPDPKETEAEGKMAETRQKMREFYARKGISYP